MTDQTIETLNRLHGQFGKLITGQFHNMLWQVMVNQSTEPETCAFTEVYSEHGQHIAIACQSRGYIPTHCYFLRIVSNEGAQRILDELNRAIFGLLPNGVWRIVGASMAASRENRVQVREPEPEYNARNDSSQWIQLTPRQFQVTKQALSRLVSDCVKSAQLARTYNDLQLAQECDLKRAEVHATLELFSSAKHCSINEPETQYTTQDTPAYLTGLTTREANTVKRAFKIMEEKVLPIPQDVLTSSAATRRYLQARMQGLEHEVFTVVFLTNQHGVIACEEMFRGTIDGAAVYPREVVKAALQHNAAAVILAHNHPSGVAEPSGADLAITNRLQEALRTVDIRVLDHLVIGAGTVVSFAERNLL